ncbi:MAG: hypothetical protein AUI15_38360 [Actinobacteria bacterium 13_2_20CM_2_66_6]|nr:MAG: hypothetical protein AUI15_38360 [Actinobacteria bacterium 13_2_20CM_2_66_6]
MSSLESVVRVLRWSDARSSAVRYVFHALLAAAAWVLVVVIVARFIPLEQAVRVAAFGAPFAFAAIAVAWIAARPRPMRLMRTADLQLGLKERLSTAWERRLEDGPMDAMLRRDALEKAARARLAAAYPVGLRRGEVMLTAAVAIAAVGLVLLPNPMDQVLAQRRADQAAQAQAAATVAAAQKKLAAASTPAPVDPQVQKILQDTRAKIASAPDPRAALQNITPAEQQLLQLSDPQTPARASSAQNLANSLSATSAGRSASRAITASPSQGAQSMRDLASQLQSLSPQDRAQLAQALAAAARQAKDPQMSASLQKASSTLADGDLIGAELALQELAGQLDALQQQENNDQEIAAAINGLEAARQQLASQADRDAGQSPATASASPRASGSGNGNSNGNGNGSANGSGNGNGNGNGGGSGGAGGQGSSGSGAGQGSAAQSTERVYVPAVPLPGQSENDPAPLGPGQDVPQAPYTQVIQAYQQVALDAADQSLIPGSERDLIRAYFSSLGEPSTGK